MSDTASVPADPTLLPALCPGTTVTAVVGVDQTDAEPVLAEAPPRCPPPRPTD